MNWTQQDIMRFRNWECQMMGYRAHKKLYPESMDQPPSKPQSYDSWKYGPPLITEKTPTIQCKGDELVDNSWKYFNEIRRDV
jgi:hypothetical protein